MTKYSYIKLSQQGFTLSEILIVVTIIAILVALAYPTYTGYIIKTKRTDMMADLQNMANRIQAQKIASGTYNNISLTNVYVANTTAGVANYPLKGTPLYNVQIFSEDNGETQMTGGNMNSGNWKLKAVPIATGMMSGDGTLSLDSSGIKCRASTCGVGSEWNP